jgi:hypothetical protein
MTKFKKPRRKPKRLARSARYAYLKSRKEAFDRAVEVQYGTQGAASGVRRIDPLTGQLVGPADVIRQSIGAEWATRL